MGSDLDLVNVEIGKRIKKNRKQQNLTQSELGEIIGVSAQQINKYESGKDRINVIMLYKIAKVLKCEIQMLLPESRRENSSKMLSVAETPAQYKFKKKNSKTKKNN